jgi:hypothetical protein
MVCNTCATALSITENCKHICSAHLCYPLFQARTASPKQYASIGVLYCGVNTSQPGEYTITYTAQQVRDEARGHVMKLCRLAWVQSV